MRILVAPDSFKDCLTAVDVAKYIAQGISEISPAYTIITKPVADGGEGTVDCIIKATNGRLIHCNTVDPVGRRIRAAYGVINEDTAVIELCAASGLELLSPLDRNPMNTSTYGTGLLIKDAIQQGFRKIIVTLGGSATNDGGAGLAQALGYKFLDENGNEIEPIGKNLIRINSIDSTQAMDQVKDVTFEVACDVDNLFTGAHGATYTYGPQKGAKDDDLKSLEAGMVNLAKIISQDLGVNIANRKGAGAAGGAGGGLIAFCGANLISGFDLVAQSIDLEESIKNVDLVVTGEGKVDVQTARGKVVHGIHLLCKKHARPLKIVCGTIEEKGKQWCEKNRIEHISLYDIAGSKKNAVENAKSHLIVAGKKILHS